MNRHRFREYRTTRPTRYPHFLDGGPIVDEHGSPHSPASRSSAPTASGGMWSAVARISLVAKTRAAIVAINAVRAAGMIFRSSRRMPRWMRALTDRHEERHNQRENVGHGVMARVCQMADNGEWRQLRPAVQDLGRHRPNTDCNGIRRAKVQRPPLADI